MEQKLTQEISSNDPSKNTNNIQVKCNYFSIINKNCLSNDDYIKLFYNSKNSGLNKNFALNVIYNKRKSKSTK